MAEAGSFDELLGRLRAGDEGAAAEVFARFTQRLIALARAHLPTPVGRKEDPEDVVQSAYRSFFRRQRQGQFRLDGWDGLWGLLALITVRKCGDRMEYFRAARRDVRREAAAPGPTTACAAWEALAREPTPLEAAAISDLLCQLMHGLGPTDRQILTLHLQGHTAREVAERVGYSLRTVRRALDAIRRRFHQHYPDLGDSP